jgi:energy-coupling factor transporter ATP-binding protein EcfA2
MHLLGWSSFQQLCLTIVREILGQTTESYLDSNDAGQDGAFAGNWVAAATENFSGKFVIQCKFSGKSGYRLTQADIANEIPKLRKLVSDGVCDVYILMTNAGISGKQALRIKTQLFEAGAKHVAIYGSTWIEEQIRENTRLRMLVPRLYGLGDLSQILDERAYKQARAVLESLREDLAKVVITNSYRNAVKALDEHGFVLLIGEPAAGKTTIAFMLAMAAADKWKSSVIKLADSSKMVDRWNVDEPSQFFWIDDAFGITQYESPLAHGWNHSLAHIKTMLRKGAKIVMTSRDYIYNRARHDLKDSAFPLLNESQVVINVHDLTDFERQQILYNHIKLGKQPIEFRSEIKPHLESMAAHSRFIPETARRIADPLFTNDLYLSDYHLRQFVEKREQLLIEVIQGLDKSSKAALGLIYLRKDHLESPVILEKSELQAIERLGSTLGECLISLDALNGSLVTLMYIDDQPEWRFKHPTIGDAYASTLASSPDLLGIFLSGSATDNLISQVTCGNVGIENAVIIPKSLFPMMIPRLKEFSNTEKYKVEWLSRWGAKRDLCQFLARRCSKEFLALYIQDDIDTLTRISEPSPKLQYSAEVDLVLRLHDFNLLPEEVRKRFVTTVSHHAISGEDGYAMENARMRQLFTDSEYKDLVESIRTNLLPKLADVRTAAQRSYNFTDSPSDQMQDTIELFNTLKEVYHDDEIVITLVEHEIALANVWIDQTEPNEPKISPRTLGNVELADERRGSRSIFDDIDDDGS